MKAGRHISWLGAAVFIAASVAAAIGLTRGDDAPPNQPAERNLFSFIKPLDWPAQEARGKPRDPAPPDAAQAARDIAQAQAAAQRMRAEGAGADDINRMRAAALPAETAARLAQMDSAEAMWNSRLNAYFEERRRLSEQLSNLAAEDRDRALRQLRDSRFTAEEQALLAAYETHAVPKLTQEPASESQRNIPLTDQ